MEILVHLRKETQLAASAERRNLSSCVGETGCKTAEQRRIDVLYLASMANRVGCATLSCTK